MRSDSGPLLLSGDLGCIHASPTVFAAPYVPLEISKKKRKTRKLSKKVSYSSVQDSMAGLLAAYSSSESSFDFLLSGLLLELSSPGREYTCQDGRIVSSKHMPV